MRDRERGREGRRERQREREKERKREREGEREIDRERGGDKWERRGVLIAGIERERKENIKREKEIICSIRLFHCRYKHESTEDRTFRMLEEHTTYLENLRNVKMKEKAELEQQFERLDSIADKVFSYVPR